MAPNYLDATNVPSYRSSNASRKRGPYEVYHNNGRTYESYEYENSTSSEIYWSNHDKYDTSYTQTLIYPTREIEKNVKKLLKRMADDMCKYGWINHIPYYLEPKLKPVSLRGVRYDGRGWANANN
jgi:hypothetical protein